MKVKDAQKLLNVSRATVHNWIRSGKLKLNRVLQNGYVMSCMKTCNFHSSL